MTLVPTFSTVHYVNAKHRKTLEDIFKKPTLSSIPWKDIEALLISIGADISESEGSRIRIKLNNVRAIFHRPHPKKETDKSAVASMKRFLENAEIKP